MIPLCFATTNQGKLREAQGILSPLGYSVTGIQTFERDFNVIEDGTTFAENALKKANACLQWIPYAAFSDDSGLEIEALNGRPGIYSARYAGIEGAKQDAENRHKVLNELVAVPWTNRRARFVCSIAYCEKNMSPVLFHGTLEGYIALHEQGNGGFGYDPIFFVPQLNCTLAQLSADEKNTLSHRGHALRQLAEYLKAKENKS